MEREGGPKHNNAWRARIWGTKSELYLKPKSTNKQNKKKSRSMKFQEPGIKAQRKKNQRTIKHQRTRNINPKNTYHGETGAGTQTDTGADI